MQTYLLTANLFAITALLLGINGFSRDRYSSRLVPLFWLVISRSLIFIIFLQTSEGNSSEATPPVIAALEVFSTGCVVWALTDFSALTEVWRRVAWLGGGAVLFLTVFSLIPDWPVPYQLISILIAILGAPLILVSLGRIGWLHLASILILAAANFFSLIGLINVSWLALLLSYAFLIGALHWESLQLYRDRYIASKNAVNEAVYVSRERQRLVEVSEVISTVPSLDEAMIHITRSMAHITHSDQSAIFVLDTEARNRACLTAVYSPERPVSFTYLDQITIRLADCAPLQAAMGELPEKVILVHSDSNIFSEANLRGVKVASRQISGIEIVEDVAPARDIDPSSLESLYSIWQEDRVGPTFIQPLTIQGQAVGALVLGNPVTKRSIRENDQALCDSLSAQIAALVVAYHKYADLELRVGSVAASESEPIPAPFVEAMAGEDEPADDFLAQVKSRPTPAVSLLPQRSILTPKSDIKGELDHYMAILETVDDGVVVSNATGRVKMVNQAAERILGKSRSELLDQPIGSIYGQIDSGEPIENLAAAFSRRNQPLPTYKEDEERAIQGRLIPWRNANSEWLGLIVVFRDVTYQFKSDKTRNNSITALSRVLRGPLAIIKGYVELITDGSIGEYSSEQLKVQQIIQGSAERMAQTLDNAVQISMQNKRELLPKFEEVDVGNVIEDVIYASNPLIQLSELKLVQDVKADLPTITADPKHIYRILENLLSNACRFTPPGGQVTLRAWVQQEREGSIARPYLWLTVSDNGVGIPPAEHKRIFEPFYQLGNQTPDDRPGLGMGLAVVKELIEWHNGRVWVESILGEGSIFQVVLPLRQY